MFVNNFMFVKITLNSQYITAVIVGYKRYVAQMDISGKLNDIFDAWNMTGSCQW